MKLIQKVQADIIDFLESNEELFFNERDFQIHLALWLKESSNAYDDVDVEYSIPTEILGMNEDGSYRYPWRYKEGHGGKNEKELRLDIVVKKDGEYLPIELKYKTKAIEKVLLRFDENISEQEGNVLFRVMKSQGAQNLGMYDFWKDVRRLELVSQRFHRVKGGLAVFLTNDRFYLSESIKGSSNYSLFSMKEGRHEVSKSWLKPDSASVKTRPSFSLDKGYEIHWRNTEAEGEALYYCIVTI